MQPLDPALVLDPAILPPDSDSDWEYEYDDNQTESFYLNLDLTSHNGPIRPARRRTDPSATPPATNTPSSSVAPPTEDNEPPLASTESDLNPAERLQLLGLHTANPVVSYQNQIFSCTWADQIGTELFFSHPDPDPDPESAQPSSVTQTPPLARGKDFDLLAANSVKILGRRANLISSTGPAQTDTPAAAATDTSDTPATTAPYRAAPPTNQMRFLQQLKEIKASRGETDTVRTVFSAPKRSQNLEDRLRGWARTEEQLAEIKRLNDAAMQGDEDAITELENLYAQIGVQMDED